MPSIRELKTKWQIRFHDSSRSPKRTTISIPKSDFPRRRDAEKEAERLGHLYRYTDHFDPWTEDYSGSLKRGPGATVQEAIDEYVEHKKRLGRRDQQGGWNEITASKNEQNLDRFARMVGERRPVRQLTIADLETYIFQDDLERSSSSNYRKLLKTWVGWLKEEGYHDTLEVPRALKSQKKVQPLLREDELEKVCHAHREICIHKMHQPYVPQYGRFSPLKKWPMTMAFRFAFYQCLRRSEVVAIRVGGVDTDRWQMVVGDKDFIPKGRDQAIIPIMPPARGIAECLTKGREPDERLFGRKDGRKLYEAVKAALEHCVDEDRLPPAKLEADFHSLRRGGIVHWLEKGYSYRDVKYLARHSSVRTTEAYDRYIPEGALERANLLEKG